MYVPPSHRACQPLLQRDHISCFACSLFEVGKKQLPSVTHFVEQAPCGIGSEHYWKATEHVCHVVEELVGGYEEVENGKGERNPTSLRGCHSVEGLSSG
jgi:hypothetical protein